MDWIKKVNPVSVDKNCSFYGFSGGCAFWRGATVRSVRF
jgi:hypothetical protein